MSAGVLFGASGFLIYRLFIYRHFLGVSVEWPAILLLMMAIITCSIAWIGWRTTQSLHQIHVIIVSEEETRNLNADHLKSRHFMILRIVARRLVLVAFCHKCHKKSSLYVIRYTIFYSYSAAKISVCFAIE